MEEVIRRSFKPEFINRIDEIIVFHRLDQQQISRIVKLQLDLLTQRMQKRGLRSSMMRKWLILLPKWAIVPILALVQSKGLSRR